MVCGDDQPWVIQWSVTTQTCEDAVVLLGSCRTTEMLAIDAFGRLHHGHENELVKLIKNIVMTSCYLH